jgi:hypothetical protein
LGAPHTTWTIAGACVDGEHLQLVGLRVSLGGQHLRDEEGRELLGRILHAFDFQPDRRQRFEYLLQTGIGLEMLFEPRKSELHAPTPPLKVGTSSAAKP